ncbi:MAG: AI-2E family transporter [Candidatus Deferrimicrobiaceae bacterium]
MTSRNDFRSAGMLFKFGIAAAGLFLAAYLLWNLRSLIVPVAVAGLMAYIFRPLIAHLERYRIPRNAAIGLLLVVFVLAGLFIAGRIAAVIPDETTAIELKVRGLYKLNENYRVLMGLDPSLKNGNRFYRLTHEDTDPIVDWINRQLALTPEERSLFLALHPRGLDASAGSDRLLEYHRANRKTLKLRAPSKLAEVGGVRPVPEGPAQVSAPALKRPLSTLGHILSAWLIAPLVFLFLLSDAGEIKRGILSSVPNSLFEPALRVLEDLDRALGSYLRGLFLECALLGLSVTVLLVIVGVSPRWAVAIGVFTGATDVMPYMGTVAALLGSLTYALLAEEIHPLLPMVNPGNFVIWVIAAVGLAELLKDVIYDPVVLGGAVKLHPLVVVIGVVGGGMLFDVAGVFLAIPVITIFKVFVSSTARQLKAYGLV